MGIINSIGTYFQKVLGGFTFGTQTDRITVTGNITLEQADVTGSEYTFPPQSGLLTLGSGSIGKIPKFITQYQIGDSLISETGSMVTISGSTYVMGNVTASIFTGSFYGDGTNLTGVTSYTDADTLIFINSINVVSGSSQLTGSYDVRYERTGRGIVSGSSQLTSSYDTRYERQGRGIVSGSSQIVSILVPLNNFSGSINSYTASNNITNNLQDNRLTNLENATSSYESTLTFNDTPTIDLIRSTNTITAVAQGGIVSGSSQITYSGISGKPSGLVSGSSQLTSSYDTRYERQGRGIVSGSSQLTSSYDVRYERTGRGIVSGSSQVLSFGTDNQIPIVNAAGTNFEYTASLTFNASNNGLQVGIDNTDVGRLLLYGGGTGGQSLGGAIFLYADADFDGTNDFYGIYPWEENLRIVDGGDAPLLEYILSSNTWNTPHNLDVDGYITSSGYVVPGGTADDLLLADGTTGSLGALGAGTVTSVASGNGMNFTTITGAGTVTMGTPSTLTSATSNGTTATSHTHAITTGISNTNIVKIASATVNNGEYAKFISNGLEGRTTAEVLSDIGAATNANISSSLSIPSTQIVYGTGTGITSSTTFTYTSGTYTLFGTTWEITNNSLRLGTSGVGARTIINGSASSGDKTITFPNQTGTVALTSDIPGGLVSGSSQLTSSLDPRYLTPTASATVAGKLELFSDTVQSVAGNTVTTTASRTYGIQLNSSGQAVVNVPWTNTTYSEISDANLQAPAGSTSGLISGRRIENWANFKTLVSGSSQLTGSFVTLDTTQTITGLKTFNNASGVYLSGTTPIRANGINILRNSGTQFQLGAYEGDDMDTKIFGFGGTTSILVGEELISITGSIISIKGDITQYNPINNGNPSYSIGSSATERLLINPVYASGTQTLNYVDFKTYTASATAQRGKMNFSVDETLIYTIVDDGIQLAAGKQLLATDSGGTDRTILYLDSSTQDLHLLNNSNGDGGNIVFRTQTGGGTTATFTSGGNVGINDTSPLYKFTTNGGTSFTTAHFYSAEPVSSNFYTNLRIGTSGSAASGKTGAIGYFEKGGDLGNSGVFICNYTDNELTDSVFIKKGGNVGIGTSSPTSSLHIYGQNHNSTWADGVLIVEQLNGNRMFIDGNDIDVTGSIPGLNTTLYLQDYSKGNVNFGGNIITAGSASLSTIPAASTDTDKFLVADGAVVKYRTGAQVLSDIGAGSPGGSASQIQYNNSGSFGGIAGSSFQSTYIELGQPLALEPTSSANATEGSIAYDFVRNQPVYRSFNNNSTYYWVPFDNQISNILTAPSASLNWLEGASGYVSLTANSNLAISNVPIGASGTVLVKQDGAGGRTLSITWSGITTAIIGSTTSINTTSNKYSTITYKRFTQTEGTLIYGQQS